MKTNNGLTHTLAAMYGSKLEGEKQVSGSVPVRGMPITPAQNHICDGSPEESLVLQFSAGDIIIGGFGDEKSEMLELSGFGKNSDCSYAERLRSFLRLDDEDNTQKQPQFQQQSQQQQLQQRKPPTQANKFVKIPHINIPPLQLYSSNPNQQTSQHNFQRFQSVSTCATEHTQANIPPTNLHYLSEIRGDTFPRQNDQTGSYESSWENGIFLRIQRINEDIRCVNEEIATRQSSINAVKVSQPYISSASSQLATKYTDMLANYQAYLKRKNNEEITETQECSQRDPRCQQVLLGSSVVKPIGSSSSHYQSASPSYLSVHSTKQEKQIKNDINSYRSIHENQRKVDEKQQSKTLKVISKERSVNQPNKSIERVQTRASPQITPRVSKENGQISARGSHSHHSGVTTSRASPIVHKQAEKSSSVKKGQQRMITVSQYLGKENVCSNDSSASGPSLAESIVSRLSINKYTDKLSKLISGQPRQSHSQLPRASTSRGYLSARMMTLNEDDIHTERGGDLKNVQITERSQVMKQQPFQAVDQINNDEKRLPSARSRGISGTITHSLQRQQSKQIWKSLSEQRQ